MELNHEIVTEAPRAAATVVLLRDDRGLGLEVFLLRRHTASAVLGGVYVFPGGKLDEADSAPEHWAPLQARAADLHARLGEDALTPVQAVSLYVAAVREAREECGVVLDAATLVPWSRWITPVQPSVTNRRFDTRFFLAVLPPGREPVHDDVEAVESLWLTLREALTRYWSRTLPLAPPQIMTLTDLLDAPDVSSLMQRAHARRPPCIQPEPFDDAKGVRIMCYPGDPQHSSRTRVMAGPTRLRFDAGRFEPEGGLPALLGTTSRSTESG